MIEKTSITMPLTEPEFAKIKEMQGKGEILDDIVKEVGRSGSVVSAALKVNTLEDYLQKRREDSRRYAENQRVRKEALKQGHSVQVTTLQPKTPYGRLRQLRDHVDQAFIDIIVSEIQATQGDIVEENKRLTQENEELKQQLEGSSDKFINGLKNILHPEPQIVDRKTLLPLFLTANKRVAYRLSDLKEILSDESWKDFSDMATQEEKHSFLNDQGEHIIPTTVVEKWMNHTSHKLEKEQKKLGEQIASPTLV